MDGGKSWLIGWIPYGIPVPSRRQMLMDGGKSSLTGWIPYGIPVPSVRQMLSLALDCFRDSANGHCYDHLGEELTRAVPRSTNLAGLFAK